MTPIDEKIAASMPLPDLGYQQVNIPASKTEYADALHDALGGVAGMGPQPDDLGNMQSVYRLDHGDGGDLILTFPAAVKAADLKAAIQAYEPAPPAAPRPAFADVLTEHLAGIDPATITATDPLSVAMKAALEAARSEG